MPNLDKLLKIKNTIFLFDIDDTLINTNLANFLAYKDAIFSAKNFLIDEKFMLDRCDKRILKNLNLSNDEMIEIQKLKNKFFLKYLNYTKINSFALLMLRIFHKNHKVFLVTNASKNRIKSILKYHKFNQIPEIFFNKKSSGKYANFISKFNIDKSLVIIFDDSDEDIEEAKSIGIKHIFKI